MQTREVKLATLPTLYPQPQPRPRRRFASGTSAVVNQFTYPLLLAAEKRLAPIQPRRALFAAGKWMTARQLGRLRIALGALEEGYWLGRLPTEVPNLADRFALFEEARHRLHGTHPL